jgi:translation initiation factor 2 subunit 1
MKSMQDSILNEYDDLYEFFESVAKEGAEGEMKQFGFSEQVIKGIQEESSKIRIPQNEITGILEIASRKPNGIELIKDVLVDAAEGTKSNPSKIDIVYIGAPRYRVTVKAENFKIAEKAMSHAIEKIQKGIGKSEGTFAFTRAESKKKVY